MPAKLFLVKKETRPAEPSAEMVNHFVEEEISQFVSALETARQMFHDPRYRKLVVAKTWPEPWRSHFVKLLGFEPSDGCHSMCSEAGKVDFTASTFEQDLFRLGWQKATEYLNTRKKSVAS